MSNSVRLSTRVRHHSRLAIVTGMLLFGFFEVIPGDDHTYLWSMATGYVSIILLAVTLLIGPFNVYKKVNNPVSTDLRRDIGIWCGITGLAHIVMGIQVHMGNIWLYFFKAVEGEDRLRLRDDIFGAANYVGIIAGVILLVLLLLSNDASLKLLKTCRWKNLQRLNYLFFMGVLIHGILYQIIEKRIVAISVLFISIMLIPVVGQSIGIIARKKAKKSP